MELYARYHKYFQCGGTVITCEPTFSHGLQNMCDSYTCQFQAYSHIHSYFVVFLGCESRLVMQFYKSSATNAIVPRKPIHPVIVINNACTCYVATCMPKPYEITFVLNSLAAR